MPAGGKSIKSYPYKRRKPRLQSTVDATYPWDFSDCRAGLELQIQPAGGRLGDRVLADKSGGLPL